MRNILNKVRDFTIQLLNYDESLIVLGRKNWKREDVTVNLIVIDGINRTPYGTFKQWDEESEIETISTRYVGDFQILFYGDNAAENASTWRNMLMSELAFTLQSQLGITIKRTTSSNDLRIEDGTDFNNLFQADFKVVYDEQTEISTLRLETAEVQFLNDK
jgi:hypothetical protein